MEKWFDCPELTASALAELKGSLPVVCTSGHSGSPTCEIGLSLHGGISNQSIVSLVDRCTEPKARQAAAGPQLSMKNRGSRMHDVDFG